MKGLVSQKLHISKVLRESSTKLLKENLKDLMSSLHQVHFTADLFKYYASPH